MPVRNTLLRFVALSTLVCLLTLNPVVAAFAADGTDWDRWGANNPAQTHVPDHTGYSTFLQKVGVTRKGETTIAYVAISGPAIVFLDDYIAYLQRLPVSKLNRNEQLAYWLNLYNASVIREITRKNSPPRRMNTHRGTPGSPGKMWRNNIFSIEGHNLSLEDVEMNILARHWQSNDGNSMWIYGLNWGATGSPSLPLEAFFGKTVDKQLSDSARAYINNKKHVNLGRDRLTVSTLYSWHGSLIGESDADVIAHLSLFAKSRLKTRLADVSAISGYIFSWRTNIHEVGKKSSMPESTINSETGGMTSY
jgi:hypothetical protein